MALDRSQIVRDDLPTARRGLDPEAVRAHLAVVADEVERLRAEAARPTAAAAASRRVEAIVSAAEASAEEIERTAREDAERTRSEAARESLALVKEMKAAAADLRARLGVLDRALEELNARVAETAPAKAGPVAEPAAPAGTVSPEGPPSPPSAAAAATDALPTADVEGARLVALELALSGTARDEADRVIAEHFTLPDRAGLLDEVYASVAG